MVHIKQIFLKKINIENGKQKVSERKKSFFFGLGEEKEERETHFDTGLY